MTTKEIIRDLVTGILGISLAINGYLISRNLETVLATQERHNSQIVELRLDQARMGKEQDIQHNWVQSHHDRLQFVEATVNKYEGYFSRRP